jgi:hypothetical protein
LKSYESHHYKHAAPLELGKPGFNYVIRAGNWRFIVEGGLPQKTARNRFSSASRKQLQHGIERIID